MQLCYRGNTYYRSSKQFDLVDSVITVNFMGNSSTIYRSYPLGRAGCQINIPAKPTLYQYRGIAYLKSTVKSKK